LKEAFGKARGDGTAFGLIKAEFHFGEDIWSRSPRLYMESELRER